MKFRFSLLLAGLLFMSLTVYAFDPIFDTPIDYSAGSRPYYVFNSDLDGDGDIDLAVANDQSDNVSILLNEGNGTFAGADNYGVDGDPVSIHSADLDSDGDTDLAVANFGSNDVSILLNRTIITDADDEIDEYRLPSDFILAQNYPNPFNPSTRIDFTISKREYVTITIYNSLGQEIATVVDETKPAGQHSIFWNGRDCRGKRVASGIYFYHLRAGSITKSKKMIFVK